MKTNRIAKMFDETFSSHLENFKKGERNRHFISVLEYLNEVLKLINTEEDLQEYEVNWLIYSPAIDGLSAEGESVNHLNLMDEISLKILALKNDSQLLYKQNGTKKFFKERYGMLFKKALKEKRQPVETDLEWSDEYNKFASGFCFGCL